MERHGFVLSRLNIDLLSIPKISGITPTQGMNGRHNKVYVCSFNFSFKRQIICRVISGFWFICQLYVCMVKHVY